VNLHFKSSIFWVKKYTTRSIIWGHWSLFWEIVSICHSRDKLHSQNSLFVRWKKKWRGGCWRESLNNPNKSANMSFSSSRISSTYIFLYFARRTRVTQTRLVCILFDADSSSLLFFSLSLSRTHTAARMCIRKLLMPSAHKISSGMPYGGTFYYSAVDIWYFLCNQISRRPKVLLTFFLSRRKLAQPERDSPLDYSHVLDAG
jgi:hypothetical protein